MAAWLWTGNPDRWKSNPSMDGYKAMWSYLSHDSSYVYWATTTFHNEVKIGDIAYIWRAKSKFSDANGIVAVGTVAEEPREYTAKSKAIFNYPDRLDASGWDEGRATSHWKTGIKLRTLRWSKAIHVSGLMLRQSINALTDAQQRKIEAALMS